MRMVMPRLLLICLLSLLSGVVSADVIVHPEIQSKQVSRQYLLSIFSMRTRTWPDQKPVRVFVFPYKHSAHQNFTKNTLRIFPYQLRNIWDRAVFSGAAQSPTVVYSQEEMLKVVSETEGAIGYLPGSLQEVEHVHVLEIR